MAVPPERITVKRCRDEDPVEVLYIQPKKYRPSAVWNLIGNENDKPAYAEPATSPKPVSDPQTLSPCAPKVSSVRTTLPSADFPRQSQDASLRPHGPLPPAASEKKAAPSSITRPVRQERKVQAMSSEPRKFHLTKNSLPISAPYAISKTPTQKYRKTRRNELAVFVERTGKTHKSSSASKGQMLDEGPGLDKGTAQSEILRKRPNATVAEQKWRAENWEKPAGSKESIEQDTKSARNVNEPSDKWDYESPELAEQLQQIVYQEIRAQEGQSRDLTGLKHLKVKPKPPKPPKPRLPVFQQNADEDGDEDDAVADSTALNDDSDYVFDTYLRSNAEPLCTTDSAGLLVDPLQGVYRSNMGIIVFEDDEDEALWETFGEEVESDPDWNTEEEDENAEDFYGNDYPEYEVDSDDDFDRGAYNYRRGASDDEEFGEEEPNWSDEENEAKSPWTFNREHTGTGILK